MTELSGDKRRVHPRHEAHGSVCVTAVVLPVGANHQIGQRHLEVLVGHTGLLGEFEVLGRRETEGRLALLATELCHALLRHVTGLLDGMKGAAVEHALTGITGFC